HDGEPPGGARGDSVLAGFPEHGIRAERNGDLEAVADFDTEELGRGDADDGKDMAVEAHGAAGNRRIQGELGLPEGITDDGSGGAAARLIVGGGEDAAHGRAGAEGSEEVSANEEPFGVSRLAFGDKVKRVGAPGNDVGKRRLVLADTLPIGRGEGGAAG